MEQIERDISNEALKQAYEALRALPKDATVSLRCNAVSTAVRALTAYREVNAPTPRISAQEEAA